MATEPKSYPFVENFFRQQWRNAIAGLTAQVGVQHLEEIENAVQAALTKALERWSLSGVPDNPGGWIYQTARNQLYDEMRKQETRRRNQSNVADVLYGEPQVEDAPDADPLNDEVMKMIFVCCHPVIKQRDSIILTLRVICGLGFGEIAAGLCMSVEAVRKSLARCKKQLTADNIPLDLPSEDERGERLERVLQVIYLLFNEGYFASHGEGLIRDDLCREAERLLQLLRVSPHNTDNRIWALSALLAFQASRLPARADDSGRLLLLFDQDRTRWDHDTIGRGFDYFRRSMKTMTISRYHLEAAIAACHASAPCYKATDWERIVDYYDTLFEMTGSPIVLLNRSVAVMELEGPARALKCLKHLEDDSHLQRSFLLPSVIAECHKRLGQRVQADTYYAKAISLSSNRALADFWSTQMGS